MKKAKEVFRVPLPSAIAEDLWRLRRASCEDGALVLARVMSGLGWDGPVVSPESHGVRVDFFGAQNIPHMAVLCGGQPLLPALTLAYNKDVRWLASVDPNDGIGLYNVLWPLEHKEPVPVFSSTWDEIIGSLADLDFLYPTALYSGDLERYALAQKPLESWGPTLVQHLLRHFTAWRRAVLADSPKSRTTDLDSALYLLFARLIFARYAEDRGWEPPKSLLGAANAGQSPLLTYLSRLKERYDSTLFQGHPDDSADLDSINDFSPMQLISGLYTPTVLDHLQLDFGLLDVDLLGAFYEEYLSYSPESVIVRESRRAGQQHFGLAGTHLRSVRKTEGIYYTPRYLVHYVVKQTADTIKSIVSKGVLPKVLDPACGSGSFLVTAFETIISTMAETKGISTNDIPLTDRIAVLQKSLYGWDKDPRAVEAARLNLSLAALNQSSSLPDLKRNIVCRDSLMDNTSDLSGTFDVIVGNPPFVSKDGRRALDRDYQDELRRRYESARGRYDLAYLFLELSSRLLKADGAISMVMPSNLGKGHHGSPIRKLIADDIVRIVDFTDVDVFPDTSNYVSVVVMRPGQASRARPAMVRFYDLPDTDEGRAFTLEKSSMIDSPVGDVRFGIVEQKTKGGPWLLLDSEEHALWQYMTAVGHPLESEFNVKEGAKTAKDDVFLMRLMDKASDRHWLCAPLTGDKSPLLLESQLLQPVMPGRFIRSAFFAARNLAGLFPYNSRGLMPEDELKSYPKAYTYLLENKDLLMRRGTKVRDWYAWAHVPRQSGSPKVLSPDYAPRARFALDPEGTMVPIGGTFLTQKSDESIDLSLLLGLLNSALFSWLVAVTSVERKGGYYAYYGKFIKPLPILPPEGADLSCVAGSVNAVQNAIVGLTEAVTERDRLLGVSRHVDALRNLDNAVLDVFAIPAPLRRAVELSPFLTRWRP